MERKKNKRGRVWTTEFSDWDKSLSLLLEQTGLDEHLAETDPPCILIKPNLVEAIPPPVTTPVGLVSTLIDFLRQVTGRDIIIGEGTGSLRYDTFHCFSELGYTRLASEKNIPLLDLNREKPIRLTNPDCRRWPEIYLPAIALESYLISVPVLKAHSLAGVTLTMKNMMGLAPPDHYCQGGSWKKAAFHEDIQGAIADLNRYRTPDFTILDATVGMCEAHLWGRHCEPPPNLLAGGYDPVALDSFGAGLLGRHWQDIGHIRAVDRELGQATPLECLKVAPRQQKTG
ncbi:DUF362 domain-containing protein [Desulfolithobacter sp.]